MKALKIILIILAILVGVPMITALFVGKDYGVEREVTINKPKQEVFEYVKHIKNQNVYSKWLRMDPKCRMSYTGIDGTPGFVSAWDSDNKDVGNGEQEIKKITEGERMDVEVRFKKPFNSTSQAYFTFEAVSPTQTKVKWGFKGRMPYPMNIMLLCMDMPKMIGDDFSIGLSNMKGILEK